MGQNPLPSDTCFGCMGQSGLLGRCSGISKTKLSRVAERSAREIGVFLPSFDHCLFFVFGVALTVLLELECERSMGPSTFLVSAGGSE